VNGHKDCIQLTENCSDKTHEVKCLTEDWHDLRCVWCRRFTTGSHDFVIMQNKNDMIYGKMTTVMQQWANCYTTTQHTSAKLHNAQSSATVWSCVVHHLYPEDLVTVTRRLTCMLCKYADDMYRAAASLQLAKLWKNTRF